MKKTKLRENPPRWCEVEIELEKGRLSICGSEGRIVNEEEAEEEAYQYWLSFFEDSPEELGAMQVRFPKTCVHTPADGARFVVNTDGRFHGLDVHREGGNPHGSLIYLTEGCGQITEALAEWFPEVAPYLKYHLNDMKAGCEHQEALGWGRGKDIALTADTLTEAQAKTLTAKAEAKAKLERIEYIKKWITELSKSQHTRLEFWKKHFDKETFTLDVDETLSLLARVNQPGLVTLGYHFDRKLAVKALALIEAEAIKERPVILFKAKIYEDSISAPCPECGYEYGTKWLKRELPLEVNQFFAAFEGDRGDER